MTRAARACKTEFVMSTAQLLHAYLSIVIGVSLLASVMASVAIYGERPITWLERKHASWSCPVWGP